MPERSEPIDRETQWADANKKAVHFMLSAQRMMLEEAVFAAYATLDRVRTETLLANSPRSLEQHIRFRIGRRWAASAVSISSNSFGATAIGCSSMGSG